MDEATTAVTGAEVKWNGADTLRQHLVPIGDLKPFPGNPSKGPKHVAKIAASLRDFGQVRAILVRSDMTVVAGHHVWEAAKGEGWTHIAAIPGEFTDEQASAAYNFRDNYLAQDGANSAAYRTQRESLLDDVAAHGNLEKAGFSESEYKDLKTIRQLAAEQIEIDQLKEHDENYKKHDAEQVKHLAQSLREHGIYRSVVIASDDVILAGHGIVAAAREIGLKHIPVQRVPYSSEDPRALKVMTGDNEISKLAQMDDRQLTLALKKVMDEGGGVQALVGTGYDEQTLANLVYVSRSADEIEDHEHAMEWIGVPMFDPADKRVQLNLSFDTEEDRHTFCELMPGSVAALSLAANAIPLDERGITLTQKRPGADDNVVRTWSGWFPARSRQDLSSLRFNQEDPDWEPDEPMTYAEPDLGDLDESERDAESQAASGKPDPDPYPDGQGVAPAGVDGTLQDREAGES